MSQLSFNPYRLAHDEKRRADLLASAMRNRKAAQADFEDRVSQATALGFLSDSSIRLFVHDLTEL